jgi:hypothetical protein
MTSFNKNTKKFVKQWKPRWELLITYYLKQKSMRKSVWIFIKMLVEPLISSSGWMVLESNFNNVGNGSHNITF